jgi:hypothetical protein
MNTPLVMVLSPFRPPMRGRPSKAKQREYQLFFLVEAGFYADFALWRKCDRGRCPENFPFPGA